MLKKGDMALVIVLLLAAGAGILWMGLAGRGAEDAHRIAVIKQKDRILKRVDLDAVQEPQRIDVSGDFSEVVLVEKGRIRFEEANCPDQLCVKTGWLTKKGDTAVCLPNRTIIKIEGETETVDGVTF